VAKAPKDGWLAAQTSVEVVNMQNVMLSIGGGGQPGALVGGGGQPD